MKKNIDSHIQRPVLYLTLSCLLIIFHINTVFANPKDDTIRIGMFQNKPLSYLDEKGNAQGIYPDVLRAIAKNENWKLEFLSDTWSGNLDKLKEGKIDLMVSIVYSEERDQIFDFSNEPVVTAWGQVYSSKDSGIYSILDLEGKTVAIMKKDINARNFIDLCQKFNVNCHFIEATIYPEVCELILSNNADAGVINNINGEFLKRSYNIYSTPIMFSPIRAVFASPENKNRELLTRIDQTLSNWQVDRESEYYSILNKWFGVTKGSGSFPYKLITIIILIACGISLLLFAWMRLLKKQVNIKTKSLRESEEKYRLLFNSSNDAVFVHQPSEDGKLNPFIEINDVASQMYGYTRNELKQLTPEDLIKQHQLPELTRQVNKLRNNGHSIFEIIHKTKKGFEFPVEVSAYLFDFKDKTTILSIIRNITKRKNAEKALLESEEKYRLLVENQTDLVVKVDPDGKFQFISGSYCDMFGKTESELIGKTFMPMVHPEDQESTAKAMEELIKPPYTAYMEQRAMTKDGWRWLAWIDNALLDENGNIVSIIGIGRDITDRKKMEFALKASQETFLTVLDGINATVYVSDMDTHEILFMNQYMKDAFGKDYTGQKCWKVFRDNSGPCTFCTNKKLLDKNGEPSGVQIWNDKNPRLNRWYINQDRAIKWTDGRYVRLQIATDITDLKNMESELSQAHKMESIGTLAGGIAHDFNNILGIIIGNAELALDDTPDWNPAFENIMEIKTASLRAKDVVRQLLSFSRKTEQEQKPQDIVPVIKESLKLIRSSVPSSIDIHEHIPDVAPAILADATQIHQVIINLCTNSSHALGEDGGLIEVTVRHLEITGKNIDQYKNQKTGSFLELIIRDTGTGIDPDAREKIFDPYFTTKDIGKGTGMGLSVVHGIVKNHNGNIYVDSKPGKGTSFFILFPVLLSQQVKTTEMRVENRKTGSENILFVDDETAIVAMTKQVLTKLGYQVEIYTDPTLALEDFKSRPDFFDIIISDMTMPQMNGLKLSEKIRELRPMVPVIICTGHSSSIDKERADSMGISEIAMKPVSITEIGKLIRKVLDS